MPVIWSIVVTLVGVAAASGFTWWMARRPSRQETAESDARNKAMQDAILGEPEIRDLGGGVIQKERLGLVQRTTTLEVGFAQLANQQARLDAHDNELGALRSDVELLKSGVIDKAAMKLENAALFDIIAKRDSDVIDPQEAP